MSSPRDSHCINRVLSSNFNVLLVISHVPHMSTCRLLFCVFFPLFVDTTRLVSRYIHPVSLSALAVSPAAFDGG